MEEGRHGKCMQMVEAVDAFNICVWSFGKETLFPTNLFFRLEQNGGLRLGSPRKREVEIYGLNLVYRGGQVGLKDCVFCYSVGLQLLAVDSVLSKMGGRAKLHLAMYLQPSAGAPPTLDAFKEDISRGQTASHA